MKHGAVELNNQTASDIVSVSSVCKLGPDQKRKGSILEVD